MALSQDTKTRLSYALASNAAAAEVETEIDTAAPGQIVLASGHVLVGSVAGVAADVALSGDATMANTGALTIAAKAVTPGKIALADTHVLVGAAGGAATDVAVSGDATMADTGALSITAQKLASATAAYPLTTAGAQTLLAAQTADRRVIIVATVTQIFANGDGAQPTFTVGQTGTANKFMDTTAFASKAAGTVVVAAGTLTGGDALIVTGVAGTGTTETGAISVTVIAVE